MRQELGDLRGGVIGQAPDQIDEVALGIEVQQPAVFHQRKQMRQARARFRIADEQPVARPDLQGPDRALHRVVREFRRGDGQTAFQPLLLLEQITHRVAERGFGRRDLGVRLGLREHRREDRLAEAAPQHFLPAKTLRDALHPKQFGKTAPDATAPSGHLPCARRKNTAGCAHDNRGR